MKAKSSCSASTQRNLVRTHVIYIPSHVYKMVEFEKTRKIQLSSVVYKTQLNWKVFDECETENTETNGRAVPGTC